MILGIEVLCEACGTELEITDVNTDHLLKVTLKARPCPKCNRPPNCHLSCEDVLELRKKLKVASALPKCFGTYDPNLEDVCIYCVKRKLCNKPKCFGNTDSIASSGGCDGCEWLALCETKCKNKTKSVGRPTCFGTNKTEQECSECYFLIPCSEE